MQFSCRGCLSSVRNFSILISHLNTIITSSESVNFANLIEYGCNILLEFLNIILEPIGRYIIFIFNYVIELSTFFLHYFT